MYWFNWLQIFCNSPSYLNFFLFPQPASDFDHLSTFSLPELSEVILQFKFRDDFQNSAICSHFHVTTIYTELRYVLRFLFLTTTQLANVQLHKKKSSNTLELRWVLLIVRFSKCDASELFRLLPVFTLQCFGHYANRKSVMCRCSYNARINYSTAAFSNLRTYYIGMRVPQRYYISLSCFHIQITGLTRICCL